MGTASMHGECFSKVAASGDTELLYHTSPSTYGAYKAECKLLRVAGWTQREASSDDKLGPMSMTHPCVKPLIRIKRDASFSRILSNVRCVTLQPLALGGGVLVIEAS